MARPKESLITRESAVRAAIQILDKEGYDAFSLRRLGKALNVNSASLYHHFASKDDILLAVARAVLKQIELPPLTDDWQQWICRAAIGYRRQLIANPYLVKIMLSGHRPRTLATAISEAKLTEAGISPSLQADILSALETSVVGSALVEIMSAPRARKTDAAPGLDQEHILELTIGVLLASAHDASRLQTPSVAAARRAAAPPKPRSAEKPRAPSTGKRKRAQKRPG